MSGRRRAARRPLLRRCAHVAVWSSVAVVGLLAAGAQTGRFQVLTVLTASMDPSIPAGSAVLVRPVDPAAVRVGDVITYRIPVRDRRVVTHRVVEIVEPGATPTVRTKGDALEEADSWATRLRDGSVWRVEADVPHAGSVIRAFRHPFARAVTLVALPVLLAAVLLAEIWTPARRHAVPADPAGAR